MDLVDRELLSRLLVHAAPAISIYLPLGTDWDAGHAARRYRTALADVEAALEPGSGIDLPGLRRLEDDADLWAPGARSVAVLCSPATISTLRLPIEVEERTTVGSAFRLAPLVPLAAGGERFYVLALSQKDVRVLECTRSWVRTLDLADRIPASLEDALPYDDPESQLQSHATGATGEAMFHGHGGGKDLKASRQERFHRRIDEGLATSIDRNRPLVLAGVGSAVASFRSVSHHPHVIDEFVNGNPDHVSADELRRTAWPIARSAVEAARHELVTAARTGRRPIAGTSEEAGRMAATGRVDTLLVEVSVLARDDGLESLLADTWRHGGAVFDVADGDLGTEEGMLALLRY